jgi:hypothetical protein
MKTTIITTILNGSSKTKTTENVQKDDLRLEMLTNYKSLAQTYSVLDCVFDYECSQTKFGYRITKTIVQHKTTKHTTIQQITYN